MAARKLSLDDIGAGANEGAGAGGGGETELEKAIAAEPVEHHEVTIGDPEVPQADDGEAGAGGADPQRPSRADRRSARYREVEEARIRAEERARVLEEELGRVRQQPAPQMYVPPPPQQQGPDPVAIAEARVRGEYDQMNELWQAKMRSGQMSDADVKAFQEKSWEITKKMQELAAVRVQRVAPQNPGGMTQAQFIQFTLQSEFPDVYNDPAAMELAQAKWTLAVREQRKPDSIQTSREVLQEVRNALGRGNSPPPDHGTRNRLTSVRSGAQGAALQQTSNRPQTIDFGRHPEWKKMAVTMYSHLPPAQAMQKWANEVGQHVLEDERRAGR